MNINFLFKDRLAWTILDACGETLIEEHKSMIYDLEGEFQRIVNKESKLSSNNRDEFVIAYDAIQRMKEQQQNEQIDSSNQ